MKFLNFLFIFSVFAFIGNSATAQCSSHKTKAKQASYQHTPNSIVDIAVRSEIHTTLVAALKAGELVEALNGDGPFTVFAPTDNAFAKIPEATLSSLLKPENKSQLQKILTYHVVPAKVDAATLVNAIDASGGEYEIKTLSGDILKAKIQNKEVVLLDENGGISIVRTTDLKAENGIIHVVDAVVLPK